MPHNVQGTCETLVRLAQWPGPGPLHVGPLCSGVRRRALGLSGAAQPQHAPCARPRPNSLQVPGKLYFAQKWTLPAGSLILLSVSEKRCETRVCPPDGRSATHRGIRHQKATPAARLTALWTAAASSSLVRSSHQKCLNQCHAFE